MKVNITVSMCISNDFIVDVKEPTPENLYEAFMVQHGYPLGVNDYPNKDNWLIDDLEIINDNE